AADPLHPLRTETVHRAGLVGVKNRTLREVHLGGRRRPGVARRPEEGDAAGAETRGWLIGQDRPPRSPILRVDHLPGIPDLIAKRSVLIDRVFDQLAGPIAAAEARLIEIGGGAPRPGVERDRRRRRSLRL